MKFPKEISIEELDRKTEAFRKQLVRANQKRSELNLELIPNVGDQVEKKRESYKEEYRARIKEAEAVIIPDKWKNFWFAWYGKDKGDRYFIDLYDAAQAFAQKYVEELGEIVLEIGELRRQINGAEAALKTTITQKDRTSLNGMLDKWKAQEEKVEKYGDLESFLLFTNAEHLRNYFVFQVAIYQARDLTADAGSFFGESFGQVQTDLSECNQCAVGGEVEVIDKVRDWTKKLVRADNIADWDFDGDLVICNIFDGEIKLLEIL